jgi:hypothetical protein
MQNKKGQGLSTNAIILIILGVIILIVLIVGFTVGWNQIKEIILPSNNVDKIVQQCNTACITNSKYDYCTKMRTLKAEEIEIETNCAVFSVISEYDLYGIEECSLIDCEIECGSIQVGENIGDPKEECLENEEEITSIADAKCCITK